MRGSGGVPDAHTGLRRLRGVLAMAQLDHAARHWRPGMWDASLDVVLAVLTESWTALLTDER